MDWPLLEHVLRTVVAPILTGGRADIDFLDVVARSC